MRLTAFRNTRGLTASTLGVMILVMSAVGCDCNHVPLKGHTGTLSVSPNPIVISDGVVGRASEVVIQASNTGSNTLVITADPTVIEQDSDAVEFAITNKFTVDCTTGMVRNADTLMSFAPGECAKLSLRYRPKSDGVVHAKLHFESNDPKSPLDVPIEVNSLTPHVKACAFDGPTMIECNTDGQPLNLTFGSSAIGIGMSATRTVKLISDGTKAVSVPSMKLEGDADFTLTPNPPDFMGVTIDPSKDAAFEVTFAPVAGGPRSATLTFPDITDPKNVPLYVNITAQGDGPALCFCVGSATENCKPVPKADFGMVNVGGTGSKFVRLASCGTQPLTLVSVTAATAGGTDAFFVSNVPAPNTTIMPGATAIDLPLTFTPPAIGPFTGKLSIKTGNESPFVSLLGEGVEGGCKLQAATTTLDFGQVAKLTTGTRDLAISNTGRENCTFPSAPTITAGADVQFGVVSYPQSDLLPGRTAKITLTYTPQDLNVPDEGEVTIPYAGASGGSPNTLVVKLKGAPSASPVCKLEVLPGGVTATSRALNFGQVRLNTTKVLPITFRNAGSSTCTLGTGKFVVTFAGMFGMVSSAGFKIVNQPASSLAPGATTTLDVSFTPLTEGDYGSPFGGIGFGSGPSPLGLNIVINTSDQVTYNGNDCNQLMAGGAGCIAWGITGKGAKSDLQVLPPDINFGLVTVGCQSPQESITLYNVGSAPIQIKSLHVDPAPMAGQPTIFTVVAPGTPFTLGAGQQQKINVRYRPPDAQQHTATLYIESDATNVSMGNPYITVSLRGQGTTESHQTDTFTQNNQPKTDVLFVVDNSGSMSEEQGHLASNAQTFISVAAQQNTDYHIAVVTTDMDDKNQSGKFVGSPKIITPSTMNPGSTLANTVGKLGTNGSGDENPLEAMYSALSDPLINDPMWNGGFLRQDAKLAVIVVSDEDDSSSGTVDFYTDFLLNIKGPHNGSLVSLSGIVGDPPPAQNNMGSSGCSSSDGDAVTGARVIEVQNRTGGKFRSICSNNWGQIAQDLGLSAFGARSSFQLTRAAIESTIVVTVDNMTVSNTSWTYDPASNSVSFNTNAIPAAGAKIVIDYDTICY